MTDVRSETPRYAIYFAPAAAHPLWRFGCGMIGYDAETGEELGSPWITRSGLVDENIADAWSAYTQDPRRYGFHATLKAPFRLAAGATRADVLTRAAAFASSRAPVRLQGLDITLMKRFVALQPSEDTTALAELELAKLGLAAVEALGALRAPLVEADIQRRLAAGLTDRQQDQLTRFGYPYVGEDFRFHMTLTGPVLPEVASRIVAALQQIYRAEVPGGPVAVDQIAVFEQPASDQRFRIIGRFALTGT